MKLSNKIIEQIQPAKKEMEVTDDAFPGLKVRVSPNGNKIFYLFYFHQGKKRKYKIARFGEIGLPQARKIASELKAKVALGQDPQAEKLASRKKRKTEKALVLREYLNDKYYPYIKNNQRSHKRTKQIIEHNFQFLMKKKIDSITKWEMEKWRKQRSKAGIKPATINRAMTSLKAALNQAIEWEIISENPIRGLKRMTVEGGGVVRYLTEAEEKRLMKVLNKRTGYFPVFIRLLLNTGIRPREALTLKWDNVSLDRRQLTVLASFAKTNKTRHVPINDTLYKVLKAWKKECSSEWVFPNPADKKQHITTVQRVWNVVLKEAKITNFRLYDCRHTFASKLAMKGVEIYRISELLGHSNINQTRVYAHLSPDYLTDAVNMIG